MSRGNRGGWDREALVAAALLATAIVTLLFGALEVRDQNALQERLASACACAAQA